MYWSQGHKLGLYPRMSLRTCVLVDDNVHLWPSYQNARMRFMQSADICSRYSHLHVVLVVHFPNPIFRYHLDDDTLEIDRKTALQLLGAHAQDLHTLVVVDIWVVVFV